MLNDIKWIQPLGKFSLSSKRPNIHEGKDQKDNKYFAHHRPLSRNFLIALPYQLSRIYSSPRISAPPKTRLLPLIHRRTIFNPPRKHRGGWRRSLTIEGKRRGHRFFSFETNTCREKERGDSPRSWFRFITRNQCLLFPSSHFPPLEEERRGKGKPCSKEERERERGGANYRALSTLIDRYPRD